MNTKAHNQIKKQAKAIAEYMESLDGTGGGSLEEFEKFAYIYMLACYAKRLFQSEVIYSYKEFDLEEEA